MNDSERKFTIHNWHNRNSAFRVQQKYFKRVIAFDCMNVSNHLGRSLVWSILPLIRFEKKKNHGPSYRMKNNNLKLTLGHTKTHLKIMLMQSTSFLESRHKDSRRESDRAIYLASYSHLTLPMWYGYVTLVFLCYGPSAIQRSHLTKWEAGRREMIYT